MLAPWSCSASERTFQQSCKLFGQLLPIVPFVIYFSLNSSVLFTGHAFHNIPLTQLLRPFKSQIVIGPRYRELHVAFKSGNKYLSDVWPFKRIPFSTTPNIQQYGINASPILFNFFKLEFQFKKLWVDLENERHITVSRVTTGESFPG